MANLDFDQIPAGEQMVDNWGQPTPWMQALWQRLTEQIRGQLTTLVAAQTALEEAQTTLAGQGVTLTTTVTNLAVAVNDISDLTDQLAFLATEFSNLGALSAQNTVQVFAKVNQLIDWVAYLDDNGPVHYPGPKPAHLA